MSHGALLPNIGRSFVERFSGLAKYPRTDAGVDELVRAMCTASDAQAAERWVTDWVKENKSAPMPADIYRAFELQGGFQSTRQIADGMRLENGDWAPPKYKCNLCADSGWYTRPGTKTNRAGIRYEG